MDELYQMLMAEYANACAVPSDINEHLPLLHNLANRCSHVTEFGVRWGTSSRALLASKAAKVRMYDIQIDENVASLVSTCQHHGRDVVYKIPDVLGLEIEPTELLFIDTLHTYGQLQSELERHAWRVSRYIAFHDTQTFGTVDEPGFPGPGLLPAILEFLAANPQWQVYYHTTRNHGFTVISRRGL